MGIDAVAAEVLGVTEESLASVGHGEALYQQLQAADKVAEFKQALIAAKQAQYAAKAESGKFSNATEMNERLAGYIVTIDAWDGTTELVVTSFGTHAVGAK